MEAWEVYLFSPCFQHTHIRGVIVASPLGDSVYRQFYFGRKGGFGVMFLQGLWEKWRF